MFRNRATFRILFKILQFCTVYYNCLSYNIFVFLFIFIFNFSLSKYCSSLTIIFNIELFSSSCLCTRISNLVYSRYCVCVLFKQQNFFSFVLSIQFNLQFLHLLEIYRVCIFLLDYCLYQRSLVTELLCSKSLYILVYLKQRVCILFI